MNAKLELSKSNQLKLTESIQQKLCCPVCRDSLTLANFQFECTNSQRKTYFPVIDGIPILLNESSSIFSISDFLDHKAPVQA